MIINRRKSEIRYQGLVFTNSHRVGIRFEKLREGMSLDRDNFEKLVNAARSIMGWEK